VAHRLSTIVDSDFILVVRDGEIEAVGRHSELVALRRQIVSLEEKNGRLSASLATARDRIKELNDQLETLRGCEVHTSTILGSVDEGIFRALGVQVTNEPVYATKSLYRKK